MSYQTSGLTEVGSGSSIVENSTGTGAQRLLGNIVSLASAAAIGSTIVQLGTDMFGVWGLLNMLETYAKVNVVQNPFIITTNKYPSQFVLGDIRRVTDATIFTTTTQTALKDLKATLDIRITPQISQDGLVTLDIAFSLEQFTDPNVNSTNGNRTVRKIETSALVANNEVLALGGLLSEEVDETDSRVPILGSIPLIGWLFKNRTRVVQKTSLLLLIQAEVLQPISNNPGAQRLTNEKFQDSRALATELGEYFGAQDPVNRLFFNDKDKNMERFLDGFVDPSNNYTMDAVNARARQAAGVPSEQTAKPKGSYRKQAKQRRRQKQKTEEQTEKRLDAQVAHKPDDLIELMPAKGTGS
jgi:type II secretory pathway component GspD/PulD (secretin)